jgi:hypothetical protein
MGEAMREAALTLQALEQCRHDAFLKLTELDAQRVKVAFSICAENSVTAKQRWHQINEEAAQLGERITLYDFAIQEARERALRPDFRQQWRQITKTEFCI